MSRLSRLLKLIELLQSGRILDSQELAEILGVSRRTIFRDISSLQGAGFLVLLDADHRGYHSPHRLALPPSELTPPEAVALSVLARELAGTAWGIPFLDEARSAVRKICKNLPVAARNATDAMAENLTIRLQPNEATALERSYFQIALHAAAQRRRLRLEIADDSEAGRISTDVDTYRLLCVEQHWILVGLSSIHREVRRFELSALQSLVMLESEYAIPPQFNLDRYLRNALGNVPPQPSATIQMESRRDGEPGQPSDARRHMRLDEGKAWDDRSDLVRVTEQIDGISDLLNKFGDELAAADSTNLRDRIEECVDRMRRILSASHQTPATS